VRTAREVRELIDKNPLATPRYELVEGELFVTPSPNALHQDAAHLLVQALSEYFKIVPIGHVYMAPLDVDLEPELVVQPDVLAVPMREFHRLRREKCPVAHNASSTAVNRICCHLVNSPGGLGDLSPGVVGM
jgi:hypothetical protein